MAYPPAPPPPEAYGTEGPPPNYLAWAIAATILCFPLTGVVSIVYASRVNSKWRSGDRAGAMQASKNAKTWTIVTAVVGIVVSVIYTAFVMANNGGV
ncbi:interferon-induced transmembrane protein [Actinomadura hallensis]|uniref:Interferon-induced transmembrane protein n=1 Tax=Actinomadura hallensis TaxID=337895 RepID=A0A543IG29_9ACTN|nr:CD225/dispanin family protein [Actinomadura hallensis]TQM69541.1 interferon-induced transmembrane protein [Actinomadura hallensis]